MRTLVIVLVLGAAGVAAAAKRAPQAEVETPRAADLLRRAEERAEDARQRLEVPRAKPRGRWEKAGAWGTRPARRHGGGGARR